MKCFSRHNPLMLKKSSIYIFTYNMKGGEDLYVDMH